VFTSGARKVKVGEPSAVMITGGKCRMSACQEAVKKGRKKPKIHCGGKMPFKKRKIPSVCRCQRASAIFLGGSARGKLDASRDTDMVMAEWKEAKLRLRQGALAERGS